MAQYWLSYIDALIKLDKITDAKTVFEQAKSKGAKENIFDQLEERLNSAITTETISEQEPSLSQQQALIKLYTQGQYQETLNQASQLQKKFPNSVAIYNIIGAVNQELGHLEKAIAEYKKALSIKPDYAEAYYNTGNILKKQGRSNSGLQQSPRHKSQ